MIFFIDVKVSDAEMVRIASKGFTNEWNPFIKRIVSKEKLPDWKRLWDNFI